MARIPAPLILTHEELTYGIDLKRIHLHSTTSLLLQIDTYMTDGYELTRFLIRLIADWYVICCTFLFIELRSQCDAFLDWSALKRMGT